MKRIHSVWITFLSFGIILFLQSCTGFYTGGGVISPSTGIGVGGVVVPGHSGSGVGGGFGINFLYLGNQVDDEITRQAPVLNNQTVQNYVSSIGQIIAFNSGKANIPFRFTVLNDSSINAFVSPGGSVYVTTGLLKSLNNEAELAAVLSHELAHVVAGHHIEFAGVELGLDTGFELLGRLTNVNTETIVPQLARTIVLQRFSQEEETQADEIGVSIMTRAGYSPSGMIQLLQLFQQIENSGILSPFLSSHPASSTRIKNVQSYISRNNLEKPGMIVDRAEFQQVMNTF